MLFSSAARTLLAIEDMGLDNVGVLIDFGHSMYGGESPAEALELCLSRRRLIDIDLNDNFRSWDDDMTVGSVHPVETLGVPARPQTRGLVQAVEARPVPFP